MQLLTCVKTTLTKNMKLILTIKVMKIIITSWNYFCLLTNIALCYILQLLNIGLTRNEELEYL